MAVGHSVLTASSDSVSDPATTASIDPAGTPVLAFCTLTAATTAPSVPTLAGACETWTPVDEVKLSAATARSMFCLIGTGATAAEAVTLTRNVADSAITGYSWTFLSLTGSLASPVLQSSDASNIDWDLVDTVTATLGSAPVATSALFAAAFVNSTADSIIEGAGLTEIETHSISSPSIRLHTSWTAGAVQQSASYTQDGGDNAVGGLIVVEIGIAASAPNTMMLTGAG